MNVAKLAQDSAGRPVEAIVDDIIYPPEVQALLDDPRGVELMVVFDRAWYASRGNKYAKDLAGILAVADHLAAKP